ncbi:hypothetical protein QJS04_geneDACA011001 [Acorus gramineus]|uniref:Trichome birefringence-like C-terminal domain-containing protein n=1 Tax=Acorus gramineus TaxID=55184 RepID=A0AAV9BFI3_ACOGR|nr:hypothetical protein QJS04_geneDACA011001 [Acorus gramineus]
MDRLDAFSKGMSTWSKWVDTNIDPAKTKVFFQGISPIHYEGHLWGQPNAKTCTEQTKPLSGSTYPGGPVPSQGVVKSVLSKMSKPDKNSSKCLGVGLRVAGAAACGWMGAKNMAVEKGTVAKDVVVEKGQPGYQAAKDSAVRAGQVAAEKAQQGLQMAKEGAVCTRQLAAEKDQQGLQAAKEGVETQERLKGLRVEDKEKRIGVVEEVGLEPGEVQVKESTAGAGALFEAVGEAVIGIAQSAKELVGGSPAEAEKKE